MAKPIRQITFRISKELWEEFTIRAIKDGKNKTKLLTEFIKEYLGKKNKTSPKD